MNVLRFAVALLSFVSPVAVFGAMLHDRVVELSSILALKCESATEFPALRSRVECETGRRSCSLCKQCSGVVMKSDVACESTTRLALHFLGLPASQVTVSGTTHPSADELFIQLMFANFELWQAPTDASPSKAMAEFNKLETAVLTGVDSAAFVLSVMMYPKTAANLVQPPDGHVLLILRKAEPGREVMYLVVQAFANHYPSCALAHSGLPSTGWMPLTQMREWMHSNFLALMEASTRAEVTSRFVPLFFGAPALPRDESAGVRVHVSWTSFTDAKPTAEIELMGTVTQFSLLPPELLHDAASARPTLRRTLSPTVLAPPAMSTSARAAAPAAATAVSTRPSASASIVEACKLAAPLPARTSAVTSVHDAIVCQLHENLRRVRKALSLPVPPAEARLLSDCSAARVGQVKELMRTLLASGTLPCPVPATWLQQNADWPLLTAAPSLEAQPASGMPLYQLLKLATKLTPKAAGDLCDFLTSMRAGA